MRLHFADMSLAFVKTFGPHLLSIWQKSEIHIIMFALIFASLQNLFSLQGFEGDWKGWVNLFLIVADQFAQDQLQITQSIHKQS